MKDIRIATVIFHSIVGESKKNIASMEKWVTLAKKEKADIICFPEMNITGYSNCDEIRNSAEPIPGPSTKVLLKLANINNIVILAGLVEKKKKDRFFVSHIVVKPDGSVGVYRKLHISPPERQVFTPGNEMVLFNIHGLVFGIQLCYDTHFPELSTCMAMQGADVIFMPHASPRGTPGAKYKSWMRHLPARAYDNGVFIVACNQAGNNENGLEFPGICVVIGPSGEIIDRDVSGKETMMVKDLKASDLEYVRGHRMRYFLPNRRPELY